MPIHPDEQGRSAAPRTLGLYLDTDSTYRWYEAGSPTEVSGDSLRTAFEGARLEWPKLQIIELEGHAVTTNTQFDIPERYAADDLEKLQAAPSE